MSIANGEAIDGSGEYSPGVVCGLGGRFIDFRTQPFPQGRHFRASQVARVT